jgi:hypothetical protein
LSPNLGASSNSDVAGSRADKIAAMHPGLLKKMKDAARLRQWRQELDILHDARKTHNKLPEAVHPMTSNSPYVRVNRELKTHETYKDSIIDLLQDSLKDSANELRKSSSS